MSNSLLQPGTPAYLESSKQMALAALQPEDDVSVQLRIAELANIMGLKPWQVYEIRSACKRLRHNVTALQAASDSKAKAALTKAEKAAADLEQRREQIAEQLRAYYDDVRALGHVKKDAAEALRLAEGADKGMAQQYREAVAAEMKIDPAETKGDHYADVLRRMIDLAAKIDDLHDAPAPPPAPPAARLPEVPVYVRRKPKTDKPTTALAGAGGK